MDELREFKKRYSKSYLRKVARYWAWKKSEPQSVNKFKSVEELHEAITSYKKFRSKQQNNLKRIRELHRKDPNLFDRGAMK